MGEKKERHYAEFAKYYKQGMKMEDISKKVGLSKGRLSSADYTGRYHIENGIADNKRVNTRKIDTNAMMRLIHILEQRYHVGDYVNGIQIRFADDAIPDSDPQMIELRKVVNGK
ncbi:MAG TPA: hypothetical protein IAA20_02395 [Candidatus Enterococcus avicola]|uniref:Uncharacterized protein n=2 Tax=Lactobacillales TaxID=186826 RepID=A0A9D2F646_9ENTE|nr:hypothetical protein [Candidatus Enterococcus avicola]HJA22847.1 hypothetical protein [Candidatus Limosilactobacillus intestinavium]